MCIRDRADATEVLAAIDRVPGVVYVALVPNVRGVQNAHRTVARLPHAFAGGSVPNKTAQTGVRACMRYSRISRNETSRLRLSSQSTNRTHLKLSMSVSRPVAASSG